MTGREEELRVLVVDDSAFNRRSLAEMIADVPGVRVVGKAADGEEALRLIGVMEPDVVTLDLEMPRMDGFTFLRILMSNRPLPVIVVSSYSQKENVFKALELGALDFIAKPDTMSVDTRTVRDELVSKLRLARQIKAHSRRIVRERRPQPPPPRAVTRDPGLSRLVAIGSSTGGPSALMEVLTAVPGSTQVAILIAQHMPDKFTRTFAERLDRRGQLSVKEAEDGDEVLPGHAYVCPGRQCMEVLRVGVGLRLRVGSPAPDDRYVPSADRLFRSVAQITGVRHVGIVLTGMGEDGADGARYIKQNGGTVLAESESSAVVYGMPRAAVRAGVVDRSLDLREIADYLASLH